MTNKVDSDATLTVEGDLTQTAKGDRTLVSEGLYSQTVGGDRISTSGENDSDNVAGNRTVATQGNFTHAAHGRIHVSAVQELKLSVGGATLVLKPNGQVLVNGTNIA